MIERFKNIFYGLDRAHGVTLVGESNGDGNKLKVNRLLNENQSQMSCGKSI